MKRYDKDKKPKRITITEWVDVDTGEMIPKHEKNKNYKIVNSTEKYENKSNGNDEYIIKTITRECKHRGQLELEL